MMSNKYRSFIKTITYVIGGVALLFVASQLSIPLKPVPITLQTIGVMLIGLTFERSLAILSVSTYLFLGAIGVPVFANHAAGLQCLLGLTGGYLWGFLTAVMLMTTLRRYLENNIFLVMLNCIAGTVVILMFGVFWLAYSIGFKTALEVGLYPFIFTGAIKILLTLLLYMFKNQINYLSKKIL